MKRIYLLFLIILISLNKVNAQSFQKTIGGGSYDTPVKMLYDNDSYIVAGNSNSDVSGDKTVASYGMADGWVVKTDTNFSIYSQYEYGGNDNDYVSDVIKVNNHYILGLSSKSDISGNKTTENFGGSDYWIVITDESFNILQEYEYGGSNDDFISGIIPVSNERLLLYGYSYSSISGNKTTENFGGADFWVLMVDYNGNILWQKSFGGNNDDITNSGIFFNDKIYITGTTYSDSSGNKISHLTGAPDIWIIAIDTMGNIITDKTYGGTLDEEYPSIASADNNIFVTTRSTSDISGIKTENSYGNYDYWCIKLDEECHVISDKTIGGSSSDIPTDIAFNGEDIIIAGASNSPVSGNKTVGNNGNFDYWVITLNPDNWELKEQIGFGGTDYDFTTRLLLDSHLVIAGTSLSNAGADKTENSRGQTDFWLVKFLDINDMKIQTNDDKFLVFPNPVNSDLIIKTNETSNTVTLYDVSGKSILSKVIYKGKNKIDISTLQTGTYILKITGQNSEQTQKIIKQ